MEETGFDKWDRLSFVALGLLLLVGIACFFWFVSDLGLLKYDVTSSRTAIKQGTYHYFAEALEYRERRLAVALTYRTFLTSFGFAVGLVLSMIGGVFVLRRATADFDLKVEPGEDGLTKRAKFALMTNSPGVVFMLSGVLVMILTQSLAIPVSVAEIFPEDVRPVCETKAEERGICNASRPGDTSGRDYKEDRPMLRDLCLAADEAGTLEDLSDETLKKMRRHVLLSSTEMGMTIFDPEMPALVLRLEAASAEDLCKTIYDLE